MSETESNEVRDYLQSTQFDEIVCALKEPEGISFEYLYVDEARLGKSAIVVKNLLNQEECEGLVAFIDAHDRLPGRAGEVVMVPASTDPSHRNNQRVCINSEALSDVLFSRLVPVMRSLNEDKITCTAENKHTFLNEGFGMKGEWCMHSLNSRFRLCKYHPGGHFGPHYDGDYVVDPVRYRSLKTFMIYLNDDYDGGQTNFVDSHDMHLDKEKGIYCSPLEKIFSSLKAERGDCLVFDHRILHEGQQVTSGMKYLIRSDLMYRHEVNDMDEESKCQEEALKLYMQGMKLEEEGEVDSAIKFYRRAFAKCPEIEYAYS
jgi:hypothetical protein